MNRMSVRNSEQERHGNEQALKLEGTKGIYELPFSDLLFRAHQVHRDISIPMPSR